MNIHYAQIMQSLIDFFKLQLIASRRRCRPASPNDRLSRLIQLQVGVMDTARYGMDYGANLHREYAEAVFSGEADHDYLLRVHGYDIDASDEVSVWVNGYFRGNLRQGESDKRVHRPWSLYIPASDVLHGENRIVFRQRSPDFKWGITNLMVQDGAYPAIRYVHTDHLDTPRLVTDAMGTPIWSWEGEPFGEALPNEDVDWASGQIVGRIKCEDDCEGESWEQSFSESMFDIRLDDLPSKIYDEYSHDPRERESFVAYAYIQHPSVTGRARSLAGQDPSMYCYVSDPGSNYQGQENADSAADPYSPASWFDTFSGD